MTVFDSLPPGSKVYLAGPMTGIPQFNIPAFDYAAVDLRCEYGLDVISPAELDSPEMRRFAMASEDGKMPADGKIAGESWGDVLARDVRVIADECAGVVLMNGWEKSRGARLEAFVGLLTGKKFFRYDVKRERGKHRLMRWAPKTVRDILRSHMP